MRVENNLKLRRNIDAIIVETQKYILEYFDDISYTVLTGC